MRINKPQIIEENDEISVSAKISFDNPRLSAPDALWFKLPKSHWEDVTDRPDPFIVSMLPVAMALGESIKVNGVVSPRLAYGVQEYQHVLNAWWPSQLKIIDVEYAELSRASETETKGAVACSFSGGVDSFYTLWTHLPENEKIAGYELTHCIMINGFDNDVDLDNKGLFTRLRETYEPMIEGLGLKLIIIRTNLQQFRLAAIHRYNLHLTFGVPITACALVLGRLLSRFYIPGSFQYSNLIPEGAHPLIDHLLGTECLQIIHDGANVSRVAKTGVIAKWPETYSRLRVCFNKLPFNERKGLFENCCKCEKCIRTMVPLEILGVLSEYSTFPLALKSQDIRRKDYSYGGSRIFAKENLSLALRAGRKDLLFDLRYAMVRSQIMARIANLIYNRLPNRVQHCLRQLKSLF